jgi:histidinol-phosphatase (PHP family)
MAGIPPLRVEEERMRICYHTHTVWSDGTATLEAMIEGARRAGLDELGISDHLVLWPGGATVGWSMEPAFLDEYVARVRDAMAASPVTLRLGIEADYTPETVDAMAACLRRHPFDYVLGSVHYVDDFPIDGDAEHWDALSEDARNAMWRRYWDHIRAMAESGLFDIAAHLDLGKKFGHRPTVDLTVEEDAALDALAAAGMALEINTAGWNKPAREAYPSLRLLRKARARNIPLQVNADAHAPEMVADHYADAETLAREAGYTELVRFEGRKPIAFPL